MFYARYALPPLPLFRCHMLTLFACYAFRYAPLMLPPLRFAAKASIRYYAILFSPLCRPLLYALRAIFIFDTYIDYAAA